MPNDYRHASSDRGDRSQPLDRRVRRSCPRRPVRRRSAPTSWDWRRPGSAKAPARSSPTCRSIRRTRAPPRRRSGKSASVLVAGGVPSRAITLRHYQSGRSPHAADDQAELSEDCGRRRPLRPVAGRSRTEYRQHRLQRKPPLSQFRLRHPAQPCRDDRQSGRPRTAAARNAPPIRRGATRRLRNTARANRQRPPIPKPTRPNSAIQANDQPRPSKLRRTTRRHAGAARRLHLAGATRIGAGLLRHRRDRNRGARGERRPPPRQGPPYRFTWAASPPPSRPITRRRRRT